MRIILKIFYESIAQAFQQLLANKMRSFLSLLGIAIGIWCVISVFSAVDSLAANIKNSFSKLGDDVIYISKMPWGEDPHDNYYKYKRRPNPHYEDFEALKDKLHSAKAVAYSNFVGGKTVEYRSSSVNGGFVVSMTDDYSKVFPLDFDKGRYFSPAEFQHGDYKIILGHDIAAALFGNIDPIGKKVKLLKRKMLIVGVLKKSGKDLINPVNFDSAILIPHMAVRRCTNVKMSSRRFGTASIMVKAQDDVPMEIFEGDVTNVLRAHRRLKPREDNDFSLNELSIITKLFDSLFGVLTLVGGIIGLFSMVVGMISVANIMFVSVKERTNLIGIKKALGAKNYMILLEFLIEAIVLCLIGGAFGLLLVYLATYGISIAFDFPIFLSFKNIMIGIVASITTGIVAGVIPALMAARMDPVEAIRQ